MKRILGCTIVMTMLISICFGQQYYNLNFTPVTSNGQNKNFIPASPNAASLGVYGQIPIGNYTGMPLINIPVYTIQYKELSVPISLNYNGGGNKPDNYPSSVGNGWSMQAGGTITRVVKGLPDNEVHDIGNLTVPINFNPLIDSLWSSDSLLNKHVKNGFYSYDDKSDPDEYYFNFNGISGKFCRHQSGVFKVKSSDGIYLDITVNVVTNKKIKMPHLTQITGLPQTTPPSNDTLEKEKMIYSIVIKDANGVKYTFGGTDESIEFTRPGHNFSEFDQGHMNRLVLPITWNLTSIESPNKYKITFEYKRGFVVTKVGYNNAQLFTWSNNAGQTPLPERQIQKINIERSTLMNVSYLTKIVSPIDSISFNTSQASNQLRYPREPYLDYMANNHAFSSDPIVNENLFMWYRDIIYAYTQDLYPDKYDKIIVSDKNGKVFRTVDLFYTDTTSTRLKLDSLEIYGSNNQYAKKKYSFSYNPLALPPYVSYKTDHYGFYNGRTPYMPHTLNVDPDSLYQSKEPDTAYLQAEILQKIIFPTGGFTTFEYEPHQYKQYVSTWPFTVNEETQNKLTGGLRIKRIASYTATGSLASDKKYYYVKDYKSGGQNSSGVLAYQASYYESYTGKTVTPPARYASSPQNFTGTLAFKHWSTNPIFPMGETRGNHVTYSEVTEVNADNSFTVYKYKNYDNGYGDKTPMNYKSDNTPIKEYWKEDEGISMDIERGQLLSEEKYDSSKLLRMKSVYEYNSDTTRFNDSTNVRALIYTENNLAFHSYRVIASLIYTYFPYLKKLSNTIYAGNDSIMTVSSYEYDSTYKLKSKDSVTASDGRTLITMYKYPFNYSGQAVYDSMVNRKMIASLVEASDYKDSVFLRSAKTNYQDWGNNLIAPVSMESKVGASSPEVRQRIYVLDTIGNVLESAKDQDAHISYIWDYNKTYPVAEFANADTAGIAYTSFEADGKGRWAFSGAPSVDLIALTGNKSYYLNGSNAISRPNLSTGKTYIVSYWTRNASAFSITGTQSGYPVSGKTVNGWKRFEHRISGQTQISISGTGWIDELCLYPENVQLKTITYNPLVGISSQTDYNGRIIYYNYDDHGRLILVKDDDNNVLKKICYNYAGQPENCGMVGNTQQSALFLKNNCDSGMYPINTTYTVVANKYYAATQSEANALAQAEITANGQAYANENGICLYYNVEKSGNFTKNNCGSGYIGSTETYVVGAFSYSAASQAAADSLAQADVDANGQAYANSSGSCDPTCILYYIDNHYYPWYYQTHFKLTNLSTNEEYNFSTDPYGPPSWYTPVALGEIPEGVYEVEIQNNNLYLYYDIDCNGSDSGWPTTTFNYVWLYDGCNTITIN